MPQRSRFALRLLALSLVIGRSSLALEPQEPPADPNAIESGGAASSWREHPEAGSPGELQGGAAGDGFLGPLGSANAHEDEAAPVGISTDGSSCSVNTSPAPQGVNFAAVLLGLGAVLRVRKRR